MTHECSTCEHSRPIETEDPAAGRLYCHRYAKRAGHKQWPIVRSDDRCGDWQFDMTANHEEYRKIMQSSRSPH